MSNIIILASTMDLYYKDENGNKIATNFGNKNRIFDNLKRYVEKYDNFLFIASNETNVEATDIYANVTFESFEKTLPFKNYQILDIRTENEARELVESADLVFLSGGHLPTQNKFFNKINLKELLKKSSAVILAGSAGSMNCAGIVYCPPEKEGESNDINFKRELIGLSLTDINILPHYNVFKNFTLDNKFYIEEIIIPDSFNRKIVALNDDAYILFDNNDCKLYGEAYLISNGIIEKINCDEKILENFRV